MALEGKVALVTGGAKNLGAEIARQLAGEGANLALHYHSPSSKNNAVRLEYELKHRYPSIKIIFYEGDLASAAVVSSLFEDAVRDFGQIDIVVNTVGKILKKPIVEITEEEYDSMFAVNSKAALFILKEAASHVTDYGKIITITTSLLDGSPGLYAPYMASKAPAEHFTRGVSKELLPRHISVNAVAPGPMDTPLFYSQETPKAIEFHKAKGMDKRLTQVKDIASIVKFLSTDGAWITGQTLSVNGGYTTQ